MAVDPATITAVASILGALNKPQQQTQIISPRGGGGYVQSPQPSSMGLGDLMNIFSSMKNSGMSEEERRRKEEEERMRALQNNIPPELAQQLGGGGREGAMNYQSWMNPYLYGGK